MKSHYSGQASYLDWEYDVRESINSIVYEPIYTYICDTFLHCIKSSVYVHPHLQSKDCCLQSHDESTNSSKHQGELIRSELQGSICRDLNWG